MRNLHAIIETEFGKENVTILRNWEQLEKKITNFRNHRRFTLRCMSQKINSNRLELKSSIKTPRGRQILQRAEKQLADECIRAINSTIDTCTWIRVTCMNDLKCQINNYYFKECSKFISRVRERRHQTTLERHLRKLALLCQQIRGGCSNNLGCHSKNNHTLAPITAVTSNNSTPAIASATSTTITTSAGTTTTTSTKQTNG